MGKAVIAQGGGPTAVINQSLVGAIKEILSSTKIEKLYGAIHGVSGIVNEDFVDLSVLSFSALEELAKTPASALLSTRDKPDSEYCQKMFDVFKAHDIRYFYYIGGNDSADTCRIISEEARAVNYELKVVHIPKTIDNDLRETDHTPGFGSAAKFVASAFNGMNYDNRALPGVYLGVIMGRDAGFLTAATALAHRYEDDAPHLVYIPEVAFDQDLFLSQIDNAYKKYGRCMIAVSEGIRNSEGVPIIATLKNDIEKDSHGNMQLSGSGALGDALVSLIKDNLDVNKVRGDTFGYLQRSFLGCVSEVDAIEARGVGEAAVRYSLEDSFESGSISIKRVGNYAVNYVPTPLEKVARVTKEMPTHYYNSKTGMVTEEFMQYCRPIVGSLDLGYQLLAPSVEKILRK